MTFYILLLFIINAINCQAPAIVATKSMRHGMYSTWCNPLGLPDLLSIKNFRCKNIFIGANSKL